MTDCIFCKVVQGKSPCNKVWESPTHLAFLSIYPNTKGVTVVIPKKHFNSYAFQMPDNDFLELVLAAKAVGLLLDKKLSIERTALVFEGYGVNHVHAKLYPLHTIDIETQWKCKKSPKNIRNIYDEQYLGYISTHDGRRASASCPEGLSQWIRS